MGSDDGPYGMVDKREIEVLSFEELSTAVGDKAVFGAEKVAAACLGVVGRAFGSDDGLGVLLVRGIPGYEAARRELLPLVREFALLPADVQARYEREELSFQFGWSHGREFLEDGRPDVAKGSFYANPFPNDDLNSNNLDGTNNVWPRESDCGARLAGMRSAVERMSHIMVDTAFKIAKICDAFVLSSGCDSCDYNAEHNGLEALIKTLSSTKGRLLYYFPHSSDAGQDQQAASKWCGWHCDHGSLTCLTKAIYFDSAGTEVTNKIGDDLAIEASDGRIVNVRIPSDCLAFQIGQAAQINSGALLRATPHCVTYSADPSLARCTYACFLQPAASQSLAPPANMRAPTLPKQFRKGMTFGDFTKATVEMVYGNNKNKKKDSDATTKPRL